MDSKNKNIVSAEPEWTGSRWKHPYMVYILLTVILFILLLVVSWLAWTQGWIPNRGTSG